MSYLLEINREHGLYEPSVAKETQNACTGELYSSQMENAFKKCLDSRGQSNLQNFHFLLPSCTVQFKFYIVKLVENFEMSTVDPREKYFIADL